ncbi:DMT family transporter [Vibrio sp. SCSIO 43135]|uniref:DMT family transporter n=1 Tax=Vibrio sp. SCSIO 43135 TaxID=2819096 RepID=UPI002075D29E|nr:DMT family transporter [Vibrio sp. SCSIO 43135]USD41428.1 DMT family transporter [Vibrio sp. SCSIO 43135]
MSPQSVAVMLLVVGNLAASLSDVAVKLLEGGISPFQYIFIRQLTSVAIILPFWLQLHHRQRKLTAVITTVTRGQLIMMGSGCMMVAITYLPLATANAVFYAAPLIMLPLSIWLLKETPNVTKVISTCIGFIGVLIVLRPSQFHWAAIFALGTAITLALFNILVRRLPSEQPMIATLFWTTLSSLPVSTALAYIYWQPITNTQVLWIVVSAVLILTYNGLAVLAYKKAQASQVALAEYSGLVFVAIIGAIGFNEIPDGFTIAGIALIIAPLLPWKSVLRRREKHPLLTASKSSIRKTEKHH